MKKIISIIIFAFVIACSVFAEDDDSDKTLYVFANLPPTSPTYAIQGALSPELLTSDPVTGTTQHDAVIYSGVNIAAEGASATLYIRVIQANKSYFKRSGQITITPTRLVNTSDNTEYTAIPTVDNLSPGSGSNFTVSGSSDASTGVVTFTCNYTNGKAVLQGTTIGSFDYTWEKDQNVELSQGSYEATISLTYTTT